MLSSLFIFNKMSQVQVETRSKRAIFPLHLTTTAAINISNTAAEHTSCKVVGYCTTGTMEAGADSIRVQTASGNVLPVPFGSYCAAMRNPSRSSIFLPCLINILSKSLDKCEGIMFGVPDENYTEFVAFKENEFKSFCEINGTVDLKIIKRLREPMADCPTQWLRDRLLHLSDDCIEEFDPNWPNSSTTQQQAKQFLASAGIFPTPSKRQQASNIPFDQVYFIKCQPLF